jgi:hypothetical protein
MANTIKLKRTSTPSSAPSSLEYGELAINYADGKLFYKNSSNNIVEFTSGSIGSVALDDLSDVVIATPASAQILRYNGTNWVNSATTNITALGTIVTGTWNGTVLGSTYGGTGVNNGSSTITLAGNLVTSGANSLTLTTTGATNITLPTSGTLVNTAVTTLSSLTSVGTLGSLTVTNNITAAQFYGRARDTEIRFFMEVI